MARIVDMKHTQMPKATPSGLLEVELKKDQTITLAIQHVDGEPPHHVNISAQLTNRRSLLATIISPRIIATNYII